MGDAGRTDRSGDPRSAVTRRGAVLSLGGLAGLLAVGGGGYAAGRAEATPAAADDVVAFHGAHQAGIATPAQDRIAFAAFDLEVESAAGLRDLLREWTRAAELMCAGDPSGAVDGDADRTPADSGEAIGLPSANLTITFGLGPGVFERDGEDRYGFRARRPRVLTPLGPLPGDELNPARCGGDLCVQACADDPQVAFHAIRNLSQIATGWATVRWTQHGFGRTSSTVRAQQTPRNLMGFKDGTSNLRADDPAAMDRFVWVGDDEPQRWFRGGSYLVARRIRILLDHWDKNVLADQEAAVGRFKASGAPLTGSAEFDRVDLTRVDRDGASVIPAGSHVRVASAALNGGQRLLRRSYSYADDGDADSGGIDAGLFFLAYQRDPHRQFSAIQRRLGRGDILTREYLRHTGSALFAIPPGTRRGGFVGDGLFRA